MNEHKQNKTSRGYDTKYRRGSIFKGIALAVLLTFTSSEIFPASLIFSKAYAQTILDLPIPGTMVAITTPFSPPIIRGLTIHPENPLRFDFIVDRGETQLKGDELKTEYEKLIKYFLATLTIPEDDLWVNLSPYEKERIIPNEFGKTEMGRDLLAQDYILKQLMASLTYPESGLGKKFWDEVYKKAYEQYGTTNIPLNTFNKVWIVPEKAVVYENKDKAFVVQSHLKVMLEEDYLALNENLKNKKLGTDKQKEGDVKQISNVSSLIAKEILIPAIEIEVNENKNFAQLRQIYNSMILAVWYKKALKDKLLNKVYSNQKKIKGVDADDPEIKEKIYQQYIEAFKTGVYSMIKEDNDPYTQKIIPRKYFSGGFDGPVVKKIQETEYEISDSDMASLAKEQKEHGWDFVPTGVVPPDMVPSQKSPMQEVQDFLSTESEWEIVRPVFEKNYKPDPKNPDQNIFWQNSLIEGLEQLEKEGKLPVGRGLELLNKWLKAKYGVFIVRDEEFIFFEGNTDNVVNIPFTAAGEFGSSSAGAAQAADNASLSNFGDLFRSIHNYEEVGMVVEQIQRREETYTGLINFQNVVDDPRMINELIVDLEDSYRALVSAVNFYAKSRGIKQTARKVLEQYLTEINAIHEKNKDLLELYKANAGLGYEQMRQQLFQSRDRLFRKILAVTYSESLISAMREELSNGTMTEGSIRNMLGVSGNQNWEEQLRNSVHFLVRNSPTPLQFQELVELGDKIWGTNIDDLEGILKGLRGGVINSAQWEAIKRITANQVGKEFKAFRRRGFFKKVALVGAGIGGIVVGVSQIDWGNLLSGGSHLKEDQKKEAPVSLSNQNVPGHPQMDTQANSLTARLPSMPVPPAGSLTPQQLDPKKLPGDVQKAVETFKVDTERKARSQFFQKELLNLNTDYDAQQILNHARQFKKSDGHLVFAEDILKGFFLLSAKGKASPELQDEVLNAAHRLGVDMHSALRNVLTQLDGMTFRTQSETELRTRLFDLRREFVKNGVYPFMFLVQDRGIYSIFLYPEKINKIYTFSKENFRKLGLNPDRYGDLNVKAVSVKGDKYPFKTKQGYFEGEFAIILESVSSNPEWTAWHEFGHLIDDLRFEREKVQTPQSVELNSMLFPMIFASRNKDYILEEIDQLEHGTRDPQDYYNQARKGILNGILIYSAEKEKKPIPPLISNDFELERIKIVREIINKMSEAELSRASSVMYQNPAKYLSTAEKGRYHGKETNAQELIKGTHSSPERETVRTGSDSDTSNGRLIDNPEVIKAITENFDMPGYVKWYESSKEDYERQLKDFWEKNEVTLELAQQKIDGYENFRFEIFDTLKENPQYAAYVLMNYAQYYVFNDLNRIAERFPELRARVLQVKEAFYSRLLQYAHDNHLALASPTQINDILEREIELIGDKVRKERQEIPEGWSIDNYQRGIFILVNDTDHRRMIWGNRAGKYSGLIFNGVVLYVGYSLKEDGWLAEVTYSDGSNGFVGPLAEKAGLSQERFKVIGIVLIHPNGEDWIASVKKSVDQPLGQSAPYALVGSLAVKEGVTQELYYDILDLYILNNYQWLALVINPDHSYGLVGSAPKNRDLVNKKYSTIRSRDFRDGQWSGEVKSIDSDKSSYLYFGNFIQNSDRQYHGHNFYVSAPPSMGGMIAITGSRNV